MFKGRNEGCAGEKYLQPIRISSRQYRSTQSILAIPSHRTA